MPKLMNRIAIASMPTSNEGGTEFPPSFCAFEMKM